MGLMGVEVFVVEICEDFVNFEVYFDAEANSEVYFDKFDSQIVDFRFYLGLYVYQPVVEFDAEALTFSRYSAVQGQVV
jgi:hypothetical protein